MTLSWFLLYGKQQNLSIFALESKRVFLASKSLLLPGFLRLSTALVSFFQSEAKGELITYVA